MCVAIVAMSIMSCGSKKTGEMDHSGHDMSMEKEKSTEMQASTLPKNKAQEIISAYLTLKDALVQTDGTLASESAKSLASVAEGSEEVASKIKASADQIAGTSDAEEQRKIFSTLSDDVYSLVKSTDANDETLYLQYCPMAFNNTGASWLSAEKEVLNPYFGDKMLKCGSVKEEL